MGQSQLAYEITKRSVPFTDVQDFTPLVDQIKDKKIVMLGEATHGTKEFYEWRSLLTADLIQNHGFNFLAVEGDWPPCQEVNHFIQRKTSAGSFATLDRFKRWPSWLWANAEVVNLMDWLREWNDQHQKKVGFHGLDVHSLFESIDEVINQVKLLDKKLAKKICKLYSCFDHVWNNEGAYARSLINLPEGCQANTEEALRLILERNFEESDAVFSAIQNARIIRNADRYYRALVTGEDSWNVRDLHMLETLQMLFENYGPESKCIIWQHNSHIGDYHGSDMHFHKQVNLGGLARDHFGKENVGLIGFTTFQGEVLASESWGGDPVILPLPRARTSSIEQVFHDAIPYVGHDNYYVQFNDLEANSIFHDFRPHRSIGVVYHPEHERRFNYVPSSIAERYDAMVFMDKTQALTPFENQIPHHRPRNVFQFGARL